MILQRRCCELYRSANSRLKTYLIVLGPGCLVRKLHKHLRQLSLSARPRCIQYCLDDFFYIMLLRCEKRHPADCARKEKLVRKSRKTASVCS